MLRIAICDDVQIVCSEIEQIIIDYGKKYNINFDVEVFYKGEELLHFIKNEHEFDLIFLDIELGSTTGVEVSKFIRNRLEDYISKIVFISAVSGYEMELFKVQPFNFLKKPVLSEDVINCLTLLIKTISTENNVFEYKIGNSINKVKYEDILYFESQGKKIKIVTFKSEDVFYGSLAKIKDIVPKTFITPHSSFLVNVNHSSIIGKDSIIMINDNIIPISQRNISAVRKVLLRLEREKL